MIEDFLKVFKTHCLEISRIDDQVWKIENADTLLEKHS